MEKPELKNIEWFWRADCNEAELTVCMFTGDAIEQELERLLTDGDNEEVVKRIRKLGELKAIVMVMPIYYEEPLSGVIYHTTEDGYTGLTRFEMRINGQFGFCLYLKE
jgi:hypothetical protein